jgi:hypothetical protein
MGGWNLEKPGGLAMAMVTGAILEVAIGEKAGGEGRRRQRHRE